MRKQQFFMGLQMKDFSATLTSGLGDPNASVNIPDKFMRRHSNTSLK